MQLQLKLVNILKIIAGWSSLAARRAHNPKVVGSNPAPATNNVFQSGPCAHFLFVSSGKGKPIHLILGAKFMKRHLALEAVIIPVVTGLGYEFIGLEYLAQGKHSVLRIYIDRPGGVRIDDCERVSRQLSSVLDVEAQLVRGEYNLEVSSPGVDRKIFAVEQFPQFVGKKVHVTLHTPLDGQRNFNGILNEVADQKLLLDVNGKVVSVEYANVAQANVIAN